MSLFVSFFFVVCKKVRKKDAEEDIKSTGKKYYRETQVEGNSKL